MARPSWKGSISFGLVSIPVALYPIVQEKDIRFNQINKETGSRIQQRKWDPTTDQEVSGEQIVKGFEVSKGRYVLMEESDFEDLPVPSAHTIEVEQFVEVGEVDPILFDTPYYIEPEEMGKKPYALLKHALSKKGVAAVGRISLRQKEKLCLIRLSGNRLVIETLHYPDEIRTPLEQAPETTLDEREIKMAESLVELLEGKFEPEKYVDRYREALMKRIEAKANNQTIEQPQAAPATEVIDLMEALRRSIEQAKERKAG